MKKVSYYKVELYWSWGIHHRFNEVESFRVEKRNEFDCEIRMHIKSIVTRYGFDCGRHTHPLNPMVYSASIIPVYEDEEERIELYESYFTFVNQLVEARKIELERNESKCRSG